MEALRKNPNRFISLKQAKKIVIILVFIFSFDFLMFPAPAMADQAVEEANLSHAQAILAENAITQKLLPNGFEVTEWLDKLIVEEYPVFANQLPQNSDLAVKRSSYHIITAYNSEVGQCDDSPCVTANGFNLCEHGIEDSIASNFLPFGAKVRLSELFGDRVFVVRDRMNTRFSNRIDVWMIDKAQAKHFGVKYVKVEILE
ncbi:MAG: hypothetical protein V1649_02190 [Patescibacteria group bacterium]